jgi:hypothetical protein
MDGVNRIYLLRDGSSPMAGFERDAEIFLKSLHRQGVNISTTGSVFESIMEGVLSVRQRDSRQKMNLLLKSMGLDIGSAEELFDMIANGMAHRDKHASAVIANTDAIAAAGAAITTGSAAAVAASTSLSGSLPSHSVSITSQSQRAVTSSGALVSGSAGGSTGNGITLLIIDPQCDFHPEGGPKDDKGEYDKKNGMYHPEGSLAVKGANEDSERIANMIYANMHDIVEIYVTLDTHHVSTAYYTRT